jgi:[glutamine synthetase] adenylyltransferase / [glutamine synthetase]-adenylyl-L-tyrosine phosphorylase
VRLAVIGMGKLGGRELAYSSDLDVLLVAEPAEAREEASRGAERLLAMLSRITPEGQAFHVDLNLRPEGKDGPLVRSLESYRGYYERWADHWELQALTMARPVAGDQELGEAFMRMAGEFVYADPPDPERLAAVRRMKARVERERGGGGDRARGPAPRRFRPRGQAPQGRLRPGPQRLASDGGSQIGGAVDLKLGPGGLADVEWTVQLLLLQHGGADATVRTPGTLPALRALADAGVVGRGDAGWLEEGWLLASRLRNALYLMGRRDASVLPAAGGVREHAGRMLGYPAPAAQALQDALARSSRRVRKVHERLFYGA